MKIMLLVSNYVGIENCVSHRHSYKLSGAEPGIFLKGGGGGGVQPSEIILTIK